MRWRGMQRAMALLAVAHLGCSTGSDAKGSDEPVGVVVAVAGDVSAQRPQAEVRSLAMNAPVFRDDTVTTAAGASVTVKLEHNGARWDIAEKQSHQVDKSLAWKAPKGSGGTVLDENPNDRTAAAGRHTENEAAQTAGTAMPGSEAPSADEGADREPAAAANQPKPAPPTKVKERRRRPKGKRGPPRSERKASKAAPSESESPETFSAQPPPPPPPPADTNPNPRPKQPVKVGAIKTRGATASAADTIRKKIKTCYITSGDDKSGKVTVRVKVGKDGVITKVTVTAADPLSAMKSCLVSKLKGKTVRPPKGGKASASMTFR